jgi:general secretion pathway protein F
MRQYRYRAARADGVIVKGLLEAPSDREAGVTLTATGLHPLRLELAEPWEGCRRAAGRRELAGVFRSIAALVAAGLPLERALGASESLAGKALREVLVEARAQLRAGRSLAQALEAGRGVVPPLVTGMVRAGERGSQLGRALDQVAAHLEQEADLAGRVQQALAYPLVLCVAGTASVLIIGTVVVPRFAVILADLGQQLPPSSRFLLASSSFVTDYGLALALALLGLTSLLVEWIRRPAGGLHWNRLLLGLPALGPVRLALASSRVARALGGMLHAGMPLLPALEAARHASGDHAVAERLTRVGKRVAEGQPLAAALEREKALSTSAQHLVAVGEASGQLATMSTRAGDLAALEAERGLRALVSLIEPGLVVFFGGLVAFVAAALLQAVYSIRPGAGG